MEILRRQAFHLAPGEGRSGGFEQFALEVGEPASSDEPPADLTMPVPEVLGPVGHRYGIEIVGPPIRIAKGLG